MFDGILSGTVGFLSLLGGVALVLRFARSAARVAMSAAEMAVASGTAEAGVRRGDLTAMAEAREAERAAKASRRLHLIGASVTLLWMGVPLAMGFASEAYAIAAPLWLLPSARSQPPARAEAVGTDEPKVPSEDRPA
ncbi:MAG: hypothetical protein WD766_15550 [Gemmatimonadota bacterium]